MMCLVYRKMEFIQGNDVVFSRWIGWIETERIALLLTNFRSVFPNIHLYRDNEYSTRTVRL